MSSPQIMFNPKKRKLIGEDALCYQLRHHFERLLKSKFKSDKEFLLKTKYNPRQFYRFKEPTNNPTFTTLFKMSLALGEPISKLVDIKFKSEIEVGDSYMLSKFLAKRHKKNHPKLYKNR